MSKKQPIPDAALDDRLAYVGTAGSGKTYNAMGRVERLLKKHARCVMPDPLGVWWGLRLLPDGKTQSPYDVVIFGGPHGDLPLTEHAGALIGETVAGMAESCILDMSDLGTKAAERRFMLAFLTALYRHANEEPVHLVFDEADMWAPQKLLDKEGEAAKLLGQMETIVRRGRVKGFIPWLITQRPAVLSKDVLSQVDGLIAFKLTSSQDRDAIGGWIEGQGDKAVGKEILASLPTMERGQGVVWLPGRGVLDTVQFPEKLTFDSSRTPKRGERKITAELAPLDLSSLRDRLAKVETEIRANDPTALRRKVADLEKQLRAKAAPAVPVAATKAEIEAARLKGFSEGFNLGAAQANQELGHDLVVASQKIGSMSAEMGALSKSLATEGAAKQKGRSKRVVTPPLPPAYRIPPAAGVAPAPPRPVTPAPINGDLGKTGQTIIDALAWLSVVKITEATRAQVAVVSGRSVTSGAYGVDLAELERGGLIHFPQRGLLALTDTGRQTANYPEAPPTTAAMHDMLSRKLGGSLWNILKPIIDAYPETLTRAELAERSNRSITSGAFGVDVSQLETYGLIEYPTRGVVAAHSILFLES